VTDRREPAPRGRQPVARIDETTPAPRRARGWAQSALVALLLTVLAVALTWPATAQLGTMAVDLGDPLLTTWILAWDAHALATAPLRFFDANMFHPRRGTLTYTEHLVGLLPLVEPARLAGAGPLLAHNLVWLGTFPLTGLAMFWLVRHLTGDAGAAAVAAVLYAFSHFRFGQLGHIQVLSHQWLPILLLGLHRAARQGGRWRDLWLAGLAFLLQALSSGYQAFFAAIAVAVFLAWLALPASRPPLGGLFARGAIVDVVVALLLLPFFLPYESVRSEIGLVRPLEEIAQYAARPASYLSTPATNRWLGDLTEPFRGNEAILFPGLVTLVLALLGIILTWRRPTSAPGSAPSRGRPWPTALDVTLAVFTIVTVVNWLFIGGISLHLGPVRLSQRSFGWPFFGLALALALRRIVQGGPFPIRGLGWLGRLGWPNAPGLYVVLTLVGVIASFGPRLKMGHLRLRPLYAQLYNVIPGFDALRVPGRFGILVTTGLAVLAGFGAAAVARRLHRPGWRAVALGGLGALAALEAWAVPLPLMSVSPDPSAADRWLAARRGPDAVVVLPMYAPHAAYFESLRLFASTAHWHPLVNGYGSVSPPGYRADVDTLNTFPAPAAVARLRAMYVRYVVLNIGQYDDEVRGRVEAALEVLPPGVTRVAAFEYTQIFEIGPEGPRASGELGGADEGTGPLEEPGIHQGGPLERVEARRDGEDGVEPVALRAEPRTPALLAVDQHDQVLHHEAGRLERLDRLELRRAVGDDVVDHHDALAGVKRALDPPSRAVRLLLAPRIDERDAAREARRDRQREPGVRDARDPIGPAARDLRGEEPAHVGQHRGVGDHDAEINVERRRDAGFQHELAEAHRADLVELPDERGLVRRAHARISARTAAAAAAGSAASVIGRPTTR
jgi:hypothetical protein